VGYRFVAEVDGPTLDVGAGRACTSLAFLPFVNASEDAGLAWIEFGLPGIVGEILRRDPRIALVTLPSVTGIVDAAHGPRVSEQVARVQRATGAVRVVHARVVRVREGVRVDFQLFTGSTVRSGSAIEADAGKLAIGLAKALARVLNCAFDESAAAAAVPRDPLAAEAYFRARQAEAAERTDAAITLCRLAHELEPGHTGIALALLRGLARFAHTATELRSMASQLLGAAEAAGDRATMLRVHRVLAFWRLRRNEAEASERELRRVIELADGSEGTLFWADVHLLQAHAARNQARLAEAREHAERSRRLYREAGDRARALRALMLASGLVGGQQAVDLAGEAARGARELGLPFTLATACNSACMALIDAGRLAQAVAHAAEGFAAAVSAGERGIAEHLVAGSALACRLGGWPTTAAHALAELDTLPGPPCHVALVSMARGLCHSGQGEWAQAAGHLGHALEHAGTPYLHAYILPWHIEALMLSGRADEAQAALERTDASLRPSRDFPTLLLLLRAALAHLRGAPDRALELLDEALAQDPASMWRTWACVDAAWLHAQAGRSDAAAQLLAQIDPALATLPVVVATQARVRHAAGPPHPTDALLPSRAC
jgi:tetratricopeptide (TPR) repeat protein